jgi:hypothetical protein
MRHESDIQHKRAFKAETGFGFDDADCLVPIISPDVESDVTGESNDIGIENVLSLLVEGADAAASAERVQILAYRLRRVRGRARSLRELGCRLGISHEAARKRVDKVCRQFANELAKFRR